MQAKSKLRFIISKLAIRFTLLLVVLLLLFIVAVLVMDISLTTTFITIVTLAILYLLFWFALTFLIISLKKSSGFNALLLLSGWLVLLILLPASINAYVALKYPVPEALTTTIAQRDGYHVKWDTDKKATIEAFYKHYPQFKTYGYPTDGFNWLWYYAMQQMGDDESQPQQNALDKKIRLRDKASNSVSYVIPNMHLQLAFNQLAGTSTRQHMEYLNETEAFHEELRLFFYPKVFKQEHADTVNWDDIKPKFHETKVETSALKNILPILVIILVILFIAVPKAKRL